MVTTPKYPSSLTARRKQRERPPLPSAGTLSPWGFMLGTGAGQGLDRRPFSPRVIVDVPPSLAPAQGCVVATVDAARVVAKGIQLIHGASCRVRGRGIVTAVPTPTLPPLRSLLRTFPTSLTSFVTGKVP